VTIYVVRHGRTRANASGLLLGRADPGLDELGRDQARSLAAVLPAGARIVSSPLRRCLETAGALLAGPGAGAGPDVDHRLIELDYGDYDLRPLADIPADVWARWRSDPTFRPPGGESLAELAERVGRLLDELAGEAAEADVVLVTHVSPIKAAMAWALGVGVEVAWRSYVAPASITRIGITGRGPSLLGFNSDTHLTGGGAFSSQPSGGWPPTRSATDQQ
jgi:probable phosphoglycerate mutase